VRSKSSLVLTNSRTKFYDFRDTIDLLRRRSGLSNDLKHSVNDPLLGSGVQGSGVHPNR